MPRKNTLCFFVTPTLSFVFFASFVVNVWVPFWCGAAPLDPSCSKIYHDEEYEGHEVGIEERQGCPELGRLTLTICGLNL
jgi:hypothetical protein